MRWQEVWKMLTRQQAMIPKPMPVPAREEPTEEHPTLANGVRAVTDIAREVSRTGRPPDPEQIRRAEKLLATGNTLADRAAGRRP